MDTFDIYVPGAFPSVYAKCRAQIHAQSVASALCICLSSNVITRKEDIVAHSLLVSFKISTD